MRIFCFWKLWKRVGRISSDLFFYPRVWCASFLTLVFDGSFNFHHDSSWLRCNTKLIIENSQYAHRQAPTPQIKSYRIISFCKFWNLAQQIGIENAESKTAESVGLNDSNTRIYWREMKKQNIRRHPKTGFSLHFGQEQRNYEMNFHQ